MAKEQSLSLNPTKISGVCGRLMCCLKNEEDVYEELNRMMPSVGDFCKTKDGYEGEVASVNILRQTIKLLVDVDDEKEVHDYKLDDIEYTKKRQKKKNNSKDNHREDEDVKELEKLERIEKQEGKSKLGEN